MIIYTRNETCEAKNSKPRKKERGVLLSSSAADTEREGRRRGLRGLDGLSRGKAPSGSRELQRGQLSQPRREASSFCEHLLSYGLKESITKTWKDVSLDVESQSATHAKVH